MVKTATIMQTHVSSKNSLQDMWWCSSWILGA